MLTEILTAGAAVMTTAVSVYLAGRNYRPVLRRTIRRPAITANPACPILRAHIRRELEEDR